MAWRSASLTGAVCLILAYFVIGFDLSRADLTTLAVSAPASPGTVYFVMCVDTECWYLRPYRHSQPLGTDDFLPGGKIDQVISPWFRSSYRDSDGGTLRLSWFLATEEAYFHGEPPNPDIVFEAMTPYMDEARSLGDYFGWHYHHSDWCDLDGDGEYFWNELLTFDGSSYENGPDTLLPQPMLAMLMLEERFYPACYRAGWLWENTDLSNWLEQIVPFDFSNLSPFSVAPQQVDNLSNIYDWSRAPADWSAYHPSPTDYQTPGDMNRWILRSYPGVSGLDSAFAQAAAGRDVVVSLYTHSFSDISQFHPGKYLYQSAARFPGVRFKYVNALEGARIAAGLIDSVPPSAVVTRSWNRFAVEFSETLFAPPIGAVRRADGSFALTHPVDHQTLPNGHPLWTFFLEEGSYEDFCAGGVDPAGNAVVTDRYHVLDTGSITGSIVIDSRPCCYTSVSLRNERGTVVDGCCTDGAGHFCFAGLPNGNYTVSARRGFGSESEISSETVALRGTQQAVSIALAATPELVLPQNYPNPFNGKTTISFFLAAAGTVRMEVYNAVGQQVALLCDEYYAPGSYSITWGEGNAHRLASGVYLLRLSTAGQSQTRKMMLLK